jgi:glycosyltransferase involved in cell wall biosynthesis
MRIAIYHNLLWSKYKGAVFSQLYALGQKRGIEISFIQIAETQGDRATLSGIDLSYHKYPFRLLFRGSYDNVPSLRRILAVTRDLLRNPADLVVLPGYDRIEYWALLSICILRRGRRAVFCDSTIFDRPRGRLKDAAKRFFLARCDGFFAYGRRSKEYLMSLGADEDDIAIGCQATALPHDYDASKVLSCYSEQNGARFELARFLYVGLLASSKGLDDLINAFGLLHAKNSKVHLDLIGAGPQEDELAERVKELDLNGAVTFHGSRNLGDIVPYFLRSVALVLPSHSEAWGLVVNESLSYGCPVVVSDRCGCVPELVVDGASGYSFAAGKIEALFTAMSRVVRLSEDRAATAKQCLALISTFTPERAASSMLEGCIRILEGTQ